MAPITVDVCQFDAPGGKMLTQREFTFEFNDGLDLNRLPLDLRPGHYYIITKGDPWRLWKDTNFEIIDHFGVRYYAHAADFYLSIEPQHFVPMEKIVEWGVIIWEKRTRPSIQVISTLDLLFMFCCPKQMSITGNLFRWGRVAEIRLRQLLTGSKDFRVGGLDYGYKPDFSEFITGEHFLIRQSSTASSAALVFDWNLRMF